MGYKYCSMCGGALLKNKDGNLGCKKCPFVNYRNPRPTVTGLIFWRGKLLLTKRAHPPFRDWWDLPGGFIDRGEDPRQALLREIKEETGLDVTIKKLFGVYSGTHPSSFDPFHVISIVYIAAAKNAKLGAYDDVKESGWFDIRKLPSHVAFDSNRLVIKDFKDKNRK